MMKCYLPRVIGALTVACLFGYLFTSCGAGAAAETGDSPICRTGDFQYAEGESFDGSAFQLEDSGPLSESSMDFLRALPKQEEEKLELSLQPTIYSYPQK